MAKSFITMCMLSLLLPIRGWSQEGISRSEEMTVIWPDEFHPDNTNFYVYNEIDIQAPAEAVWEVLMEAESWPEWYEGASDVKVHTSQNGRLAADATFSWKTMGLDFTSTIKEFDFPHRLAWISNKKSIKGYHAWLIVPTATGCKLITEESQYGWLTFFEKTFQPNKLRKLHDVWLAEIKKKAEKGKP